jgi:hypothetical protein
MTGSEFRAALPLRVRHHLPDEWRGFKHRARFGFVQFWYDDPAFHYEIWPQRKYGVVEVGLHLEHRQAHRNAALHAHFDQHLVEIRHDLGDIWLEKWDRGWHKLYVTTPLADYNAALLEQTSQLLARQIVVLQPLLADGLRSLEADSPRLTR